jgi:hypothetical protein
LPRSGPHAKVFGEIFPADYAGAIDKKLCGARDIVTLGTSGGMQQLVAADHLGFRITKQGERVTLLATEFVGDVRWIDTDSDGTDTLGLKLGKTSFDASQLEVAVGSPVAAIKDE